MKKAYSSLLTAAFTTLLVGQVHSAAVLSALWEFEETGGPTATDSVASYPGALGGGASLDAAGRFGSGIAFDADDVTAANVTTTTVEGRAATQQTGDFSVLVWIRPTAADLTNTFNRFIDTSSNTGAITTGYRLMSGNAANTDNFRFLGDSGPNTNIYHPRDLVEDTWTLLAVRYDTDGQATLNVLMDGDTVDSTFVNTNIQSGAANGPIVYAADEDTTFGAQDRPIFDQNDFEGLMDDAAFFRGLLTDAEIATVFNFGHSAGGSEDPLELSVSKSGADLVFEWKSQAGMRYNLRSVLDPSSADRKDWPIHGGHMEIAATPDTNTLTIQRPADAVRFFVIEEILAPPVTVFSENFDGADPGWTTGFDASDTLMNTVWQLGDPNGGPATGPQAANSVPNCYGTNLTTNYGISSNTWLRTPAIDLSTAMAATVIFQQWVDMDEFLNLDHGAVRVLVASGLPGTVTELGVVQADITGFLNGWAEFSAELPAAALGQSIVLEFGFRSDGDDVVAAAGWYIDDVVVTIPGS
jgi:hypothetical protein